MNKIKNLYEDNIIIGCILVFFISMPLIWGPLAPIINNLSYNWPEVIKYSLTAVIAIVLMLVIYKRVIFPASCKYFFRGLISFGSLGVIGAICSTCFCYKEPTLNPHTSQVVSLVLYSLAIALGEEVLFRGVIFNSLLRTWKNTKNVLLKSIFIANAIFALQHLMNLITEPKEVSSALAEVGITFVVGLYLSAIYIRTENIWICVTIRFMECLGSNVWGVFSMPRTATGMTAAQGLGLVLLHVPYGIFAYLMLSDKAWDFTSSLFCYERKKINSNGISSNKEYAA